MSARAPEETVMTRKTRIEPVVANQRKRQIPAGREITILNAGGDPGVRSVMTHLLECEGWCVKEAKTGNDALRLVGGQHPELILLDVNLPDPSGPEICRKLKQDPHTRSIPILQLHAASLSLEERKAALESDADAYLTQPVEPDLLVATVRATLRARQLRDEERDTERVWQKTFDAISRCVCLVDKSGNILQVNRALCAIAGKNAGELAGRPHQVIYAGAPEPESGWPFERARKSLQHESEDILLDHRWFHVTVDPLFDDCGDFAGAVGILHDVTARHLLEEQLRRSQKMEAVGRLAGGVAHDFNNLLTIIAGYGQMLLDGLKPKDPLRPDLEAILEASGRAAALTRELLTFSRRQMAHPKVVDLNFEVAKMQPPAAPSDRRGHRAGDIAEGQSHPASKSTRPSSSRCCSTCGQRAGRDAEGRQAHDSDSIRQGRRRSGGCLEGLAGTAISCCQSPTPATGMDAETLSHLFEPFYTTKAKGKGTGLGLVDRLRHREAKWRRNLN